MGAIERENPTLKQVLPRDYARPSLDKVRLGGLVDIISNIGFNESAAKSKDVLGDVYMYFLGTSSPARKARAAASSTARNASFNCSS
jgi:type I restriction enzyme M protein